MPLSSPQPQAEPGPGTATGSRIGSAKLRWRAVAALAGAALPLAFAPFDQFWVAPLSLALLFMSWDASPREAAWRGFWFGVAAFAAGTWWLYVSVRLVGGTPLPVAFLLLGGLVAIMAGWIAAGAALAARLRTRSMLANACLVAPAAWVLAEWLRGWVLTGFPWLSLGYGQVDGPLAGWAPIGGVYGTSLVVAVIAGALVTLVRGAPRQRLAALGVVVVVGAASWASHGHPWTSPAGPPLRVSLVQGAIPQLLKWRPEERVATMELYLRLTQQLEAGQDLVIWPEAAIPAPDDAVPEYLDLLAELARRMDAQLLVGILTHDATTDEYRNSLVALGKERGVYHKRHLVPFGEFFPVPDFVRSWMRMMSLPYSDISRGADDQEPLRARGVGLAPTICYEDAYGAEQLGFLPAAGLLVNVSNDAWFGDTLAVGSPGTELEFAL